ncbi:probable disease resistance protein RF9 [Pistacia vera]|uniref:probable disease resistance protein RF9 n=1 Tax=Pistacia vera TaxID=55513 RepID=UPI00126375C3|nr:probable disease resistance protein RF9 [Pistacia vera]
MDRLDDGLCGKVFPVNVLNEIVLFFAVIRWHFPHTAFNALAIISQPKYLPPFGKLPSLESLFIDRPMNVKKVGNEFLGIESDGTARSRIVFPKLKRLVFDGMSAGWEESDDITLKGDELVITIMPSLHYLKISGAPKLKTLPNYILQSPTLKQLEIEYCDILSQRYKKETGEDWHKISHILDVSIWP